MAKKVIVTISSELNTVDDCYGCIAQSCGHFGEPSYCCAGYGNTPYTLRNPKDVEGKAYFKRPMKCRKAKKRFMKKIPYKD